MLAVPLVRAASGQGHPSPCHALLVASAGPHLSALFLLPSRISACWRHPGLAECGLRFRHPCPHQVSLCDWRASVRLAKVPAFPAKAQVHLCLNLVKGDLRSPLPEPCPRCQGPHPPSLQFPRGGNAIPAPAGPNPAPVELLPSRGLTGLRVKCQKADPWPPMSPQPHLLCFHPSPPQRC